jgi:hypothetical protein
MVKTDLMVISFFNYLEMFLPAATNVVIQFDPVTNLITGNFEDVMPSCRG